MSAVALHDPNTQPQRNLSVIANMANDYGMVPDIFEATLRATVVPKHCTREEFVVFALVARKYGLNPLLREIYAIPKKGGGIQPVVGVDGWYHLANDHPQFDGIEFEDLFDDAGKFTGTTCRVWRKDRSRPTVVTEWLSECRMNTEPWQKWERRMTRHKAGIQGIRVALGFSGIVDPDEADRFTQEQYSERGGSPATVHHLQAIDVNPVDQDLSPPKAETATAEQIAQLRAMADEADVDHDKLCAFFGIADYAEIPAIAFDKVANAIAAKRQKTARSNSAADNPSTAADTPANHPPAGDPPASEHTPAADAGGNPDPIAEARAAGRKACRAGTAYEAVPKKYARYVSWAEAWREGYQEEGEKMEAEMNQ
jgi:hypothetical protein